MKKMLVANRGEIALRILRTAREMGIPTVMIASEADRHSPAVQFADEVVVLGKASANETYLNQEAIIQAALDTHADAIHPGYGFLSENERFAKSVLDAGITWIGPTPTSIEVMGDKIRARQTAEEAGVPILPGSREAVETAEAALEIGHEIGFPLLIKAAAGGGGRGIRHVQSADAFSHELEVARAEAFASFGSSNVYIERFVQRARHVEVQILSDGNTVLHLGDRDCSLQRKQQKIVEEAPAPNIPEGVRQRMRDSAVALAQHSSYVGAGTVEFLYDTLREEFAFLEMNTRLQVEHTITEEIVGIDLVREQIRVARGEQLALAQQDVNFDGHALELRINAESAAHNFMPSPGVITKLELAGGPGVRNDFGYVTGDTVTPFYDSLIGKIVVWAETRELCIERAKRVLNETQIEGISTTIPFLHEIISHPDFEDVTHHTAFIDDVQVPVP